MDREREFRATIIGSECGGLRTKTVVIGLTRVREPRRTFGTIGLAEREGFEPSIRFPVYTLSKRAP